MTREDEIRARLRSDIDYLLKRVDGWKRASEKLHRMGHGYLDKIDALKKENQRLRDAMTCIRDEPTLDIHEVKYIARKALQPQDAP